MVCLLVAQHLGFLMLYVLLPVWLLSRSLQIESDFVFKINKYKSDGLVWFPPLVLEQPQETVLITPEGCAARCELLKPARGGVESFFRGMCWWMEADDAGNHVYGRNNV